MLKKLSALLIILFTLFSLILYEFGMLIKFFELRVKSSPSTVTDSCFLISLFKFSNKQTLTASILASLVAFEILGALRSNPYTSYSDESFTKSSPKKSSMCSDKIPSE